MTAPAKEILMAIGAVGIVAVLAIFFFRLDGTAEKRLPEQANSCHFKRQDVS